MLKKKKKSKKKKRVTKKNKKSKKKKRVTKKNKKSKNKHSKKRKVTKQVLNKQIKLGLNKIKNTNKVIIAYEPVWSIGTGLIPKPNDLFEIINFIKKKFKNYKVLYGGSVSPKNIDELKSINNIDGYLIGGASQDPKKFIDIIKKTYN